MAPAVHFSDSKENLKNTFSYLNSALQHEELNRGEWRLLEAAVRKWSEKETLFVENIILFNEQSLILDSDATVPQGFQKNIHFVESDIRKCYFFDNKAPDESWQDHEVECLKEDKVLTSDKGCEEVDLFFIKPNNGFISESSKFSVEFGSKNILEDFIFLNDLKANIAIGSSVHPKIIFLHFIFNREFIAGLIV